MSLFSQKVFQEIFFGRSDVETRSAALHHQREWLEQAAERKRRQDSLIELARELDLEKTARLPKFDRFCNGTRNLTEFRGNACKGFTLIELMIVVGIIAVLSAISLSAYAKYSTKAKITEGLSLARDAQTVVEEGFQTGGMQGAFAAATAYNQNPPSSKYVANVLISAVSATDTDLGTITITYNDAPLSLLAGSDTLKLYPVAGGPGGMNTIPAVFAAGAVPSDFGWECLSTGNSTATADMQAVPASGTLMAELAPANCK